MRRTTRHARRAATGFRCCGECTAAGSDGAPGSATRRTILGRISADTSVDRGGVYAPGPVLMELRINAAVLSFTPQRSDAESVRNQQRIPVHLTVRTPRYRSPGVISPDS